MAVVREPTAGGAQGSDSIHATPVQGHQEAPGSGGGIQDLPEQEAGLQGYAVKTVIVTGSRDWADFQKVAAALAAEKPDLVVHGGADGADTMAHIWALGNGIREAVYHAHWKEYGRAAGPRRNALMLKSHPDAVVLAFPLDGPGTKDCMRQARALRMTVRVFE